MRRYEDQERLLWDGEEDRFLVVFTLRQLPEDRQADDRLWATLSERDDQLRQSLKEEVQKPRAEGDEGEVRFELVDLSYQRGSVELIVILGIVYSAIKDYDSVRKSLESLTDDMVSVIRRVLNLAHTWEVKHKIQRGSVTVRVREVRDRESQQVVDLPNEEKVALATVSLQSLPQEQKQDVVANVGVLPDQLPNPHDDTVDWIWRLTVGVFVFVLVASVLTLCAATLWYPNADTQLILTVVTTVVGTLAGFISGRASG